jgi:hypothetical protein
VKEKERRKRGLSRSNKRHEYGQNVLYACMDKEIPYFVQFNIL